MNRILLASILVLLACKKSETKETTKETTTKETTAKETTAAQPSTSKPDEIFAQATKAAADDEFMEFARAHQDVTVAGPIAKVDDSATKEYELAFDAGAGHTLVVRFADFGSAAKAKHLKVGDSLIATNCDVTKPTADKLVLVQCELK